MAALRIDPAHTVALHLKEIALRMVPGDGARHEDLALDGVGFLRIASMNAPAQREVRILCNGWDDGAFG